MRGMGQPFHFLFTCTICSVYSHRSNFCLLGNSLGAFLCPTIRWNYEQNSLDNVNDEILKIPQPLHYYQLTCKCGWIARGVSSQEVSWSCGTLMLYDIFWIPFHILNILWYISKKNEEGCPWFLLFITCTFIYLHDLLKKLPIWDSFPLTSFLTTDLILPIFLMTAINSVLTFNTRTNPFVL